MKHLIKITIIALIAVSFTSCNKKSRPNYQYMPNMYESVGYEAYQESNAFANGQEAQIPVEGTISRGYKPFDYKGDTEGYNLAKAELKSPLDSTQIDPVRGKQLFGIYCAICHGNNGKGESSTLAKRDKIHVGFDYNNATRAITEGSIYYVIYYGKNSMGSYANQLSEEERWQVAAYVMQLKADLDK